jgi:hypothetical protein
MGTTNPSSQPQALTVSITSLDSGNSGWRASSSVQVKGTKRTRTSSGRGSTWMNLLT